MRKSTPKCRFLLKLKSRQFKNPSPAFLNEIYQACRFYSLPIPWNSSLVLQRVLVRNKNHDRHIKKATISETQDISMRKISVKFRHCLAGLLLQKWFGIIKLFMSSTFLIRFLNVEQNLFIC